MLLPKQSMKRKEGTKQQLLDSSIIRKSLQQIETISSKRNTNGIQ